MFRFLHARTIVLTLALVSLLNGCTKGEGSLGEPEVKANKSHVAQKARELNDKTQKLEAAPDFKNAVKVETHYDPNQKKIIANVSVAKGLHAYAAGSETGVPVSLTIDEKGGWQKTSEVFLPKGESKKLASGKSVVLHDAFELSVKVDKGRGAIEGKVGVQVCTEKLCDRPRKYPFKVNPS